MFPLARTKTGVESANKGALFDVSKHVFARLETGGFKALSQPEQVFVCIWELDTEVNNGGFHQYYFNDGGDRAVDAVRSLEAIGAPQTAALVTRANRLFGPSGPFRDRWKRQEQLNALSRSDLEVMHEIDAQFYKYKENLKSLLRAFVDENRDGIRIE
jgi:hypothetical protein